MLLDYFNYILQNFLSELIVRFILFFGISTILFFSFTKFFKSRFNHFKIQNRPFNPNKIKFDIIWSAVNRVVLSLITVSIAFFATKNFTKIYETPLNQLTFNGWFYFIFSIVFLLFLHDAYFYWFHRLMHTKLLMNKVHRLHHRSTDPTSFTGYAFHPWETIIEFAVLPLIVFILPVHIYVFLIWQLIVLLYNIYAHLGFEIMPKFWVTNPITKYFNTPTNHNQHHSKFNYNFGLFFNIWDRLMKTHYSQYEVEFIKIKERQPQKV